MDDPRREGCSAERDGSLLVAARVPRRHRSRCHCDHLVPAVKLVRTPDERFEGLPGYPWEPNYLQLTGDLDGLRLHYLDEGRGDPILLLHGEPSWSYLYRKMIPALSKAGRVIAPDYIGFGRSDKVTDTEWYTYARHLDSIEQVITALDLRNISVVVQDWGGPIGLRLATTLSDRFARIVILNTGLFRPGGNWPGPAWLAFRDFVVANPDFPVGLMIEGATSTDLPPEVVAAYEAPYPTIESKAGTIAFPLIMPVSEDSVGAEEMWEARQALDQWNRPVLVAFSDSDPIFPPSSGQKWAERIPGAEPFVLIEGASHFLQEDQGETIADEIVRFMERRQLEKE